MFNYSLGREWIESSAAARIKEPGIEHSRERVLDDAELRDACNLTHDTSGVACAA